MNKPKFKTPKFATVGILRRLKFKALIILNFFKFWGIKIQKLFKTECSEF